MNDYNKVVLSTRVRLARNYSCFPFIPKLTEKDSKKVAEITKEAVMSASENAGAQFEYIDKSKLEKEGGILLEDHLISPGILKSPLESAVILSKDRELSIMINEEDHLRIQAIKPGYNPEEALKCANLSDDLIEEKNEYAFSEKYGYLTACPTNLGTGIRTSVMLHIPAICMTGRLPDLIRSLNRIGIEVRGAYGEGTGGEGNIYQFSNQITLGVSEDEIISKLKSTTDQIAQQELELREKIRNDELYDRIYRSLGLLKSSYKMSYKEFLQLNSNVILGADMGICDMAVNKLHALSTECAPYHIISRSPECHDSAKRDIKRAEILRNELK